MNEMYKNSVTAANKIITSDDLYNIISTMNEEITKLKNINENEEKINQKLNY